MGCYRIHLVELFLVRLVKAIYLAWCMGIAIGVSGCSDSGDRSEHVDADFLYPRGG